MDGSSDAAGDTWSSRGFGGGDTDGFLNGRDDTGEQASSRPLSGGNAQGAGRSANEPRNPFCASGRFPRISHPVELMRPSYDVVVIGSGYGGGVAASRMARGKQSVCVLERGKERWPGEFPERLEDAVKEIRVSGEFAPGDRRSVPGMLVDTGNPTGLYHFAVGDGQNVYMSNGLGGTSLVNANVFLEAHPAVLDMTVWPEELRGKDAWKRYYGRASDVLEPTRYPTTFPLPPKMDVLKKQAELMSCSENFYRVRQTTRFEDGPNSTGVFMHASTLTGMDATGINDGSKSTTLVTYLSDAWNWGAEIFCECEVRYVAKAPGREGYLVYFAWHSGNRHQFPGFYEDLMWVHAKKLVFFGAGSLGTTEILLRSKQLGLRMSDTVGSGMSGNGDMLGFGYNTDYEVNCMAKPDPTPERPVGPCINAVLDMRDQKNPLDGFVVEDCAIPFALAPVMIPILEGLPDPSRPLYRPIEGAVKLASRLASLLLGPYSPTGSVERTAAYLIMSHDSSQGSLALRKDTPILTYSGVGRSKSVSRIHKFLETMTAAINGNFIANPVWTLLGKQEITVHPIGGARMSPDGTGSSGVTNHLGEIFKGNGDETHQGLVVCDGSLVPSAVGVNPLATITALAERSVELVAQKYDIVIDYDTKNGILDLFGRPRFPSPPDKGIQRLAGAISNAMANTRAGIEFTEIMSGFIHVGSDVGEFEVAANLARGRCEAARFFLTVKSWDIAELVNSSAHSANLTGTFNCSALGGTFIVHRGTFQLFSQDPREPETTNLRYDFDMVSPDGKVLHFNSYMVVNTAAHLRPLDLWRQTSTLYVTITNQGGQVVGRGMLHVQPMDLLRGLRTFEASGPSPLARLRSAASYFTYFTKQVAIPLFSPLGSLQWPAPARLDDTYSVIPPSQTIPIVAADGVKSTMLMWEPIAAKGRQPGAPAPIILFIPGAATDHTMFALPTIEKNAINYFREAGYQTYCVTHRLGRTMVAQKGWTAYDARRDIHAALAHIRDVTGAEGADRESSNIYVVAHCAGSMALACGLLDGTIPAHWIRAVTCSMVFMNPKFGKVSHLLSDFPVAIYSKLVSPYWDCSSSRNDTYLQQLINQLLRFYPAGAPRETCRSVVCHRSELVFGRIFANHSATPWLASLWTHKNLNEETHARLDRFIGGSSMRAHAWLTKSGRLNCVTTNEPVSANLVTAENLDRLKGLPILFLSGTGNMVFTAENTDISYTTLCNAHGKGLYEREVFPGKGHLDAWMGATAYQDVYPRVKLHVDKFMRG